MDPLKSFGKWGVCINYQQNINNNIFYPQGVYIIIKAYKLEYKYDNTQDINSVKIKLERF